MKKIVLSILSIFFCLGMLTGGAIMLSGCNSSSYSENNPLEEKPGGGFDDSQNENDEILDDDEAENGEEIEIEEPDKDDSQGTATYTIRFNANGAPLGSMSPQTKQTGETITLTPCGFWWGDTSSWETSDYKFLGWALSANSGNVRYQNMDTYSENLSRTLYAVWNYTIRFNGNGATSGSMSNQMKKHAVSLKLNTNNYRRTGYNFGGWGLSSSGPAMWGDGGWYERNDIATLYAIWVPNTYTVTVRYSSSSKVPSNSKLNIAIDSSVTSKTISLGGSTTFTFDLGSSHSIMGTPTNLNADTGGSPVQCSDSAGGSYSNYGYCVVTGINSSRTLTFTAQVYRRITYNGNGSTGGSTSQTSVYYGDDATVASNGFTRTNYDFLYWSTSSSGGTRYDPGDVIRDMTDYITLYARWSYNPPYTWEEITYKANYPNGTTDTYTQDVRSDSSVGILSASECGFSYTGYTWSHWNTNSSGTGVNWYDYETWSGSRGSDTLYAIWTRNSYTNRYYYRNTSGGQDYDDQTRYYGSTFYMFDTSDITEYVSNGWSLYGWSTSSTSTSTSGLYDPGESRSSTSTSMLSYYAISSRTVSLNFNSNGGSSVSSRTGTQYWNQYNNYKTNPTLTISSTEPTRTGYNFLGWSTSSSATTVNYDPGDTYTFSNAYSSSSSVTLYAVWEAKIIPVSLNWNSGNGGTSMIYLKYDSGWYSNSTATSSITSITAPTRTGFTFNGYNTALNGTGTTLINSSGTITASDTYYSTDGTKTIYAQWTANNPAYYDSEGGYWYIENGMMPQKRVTDSGTISGINSSSTTGTTYYFAGLSLQSKVYNGKEYCQYNNSWYEVMPIKWRLVYASSQTTGYGTETDTLAVMAEIVYADAFSDSFLGANAGYSSESVTELKKNQIDGTYLVTETKSMLTFGSTTINGTPTSVSSNIFVVASDDLTSFTTSANGAEKAGSVKFSDLVIDYLLANGKGTLYYTRDLGTNYNNIWCMNANGDRVQYKASNYLGVQFTIKVTEYACV